ncbi:YhcN/YlaJ family sporulation lipoprotein [Heyndrickxia sporothermodurans]|nr:YhcN/YlaJ family sporulation lipoprotein [Heyndrickxia sporothermodurans]MED3651609.1 YhcN/YlaJ family sporulation lipoprotein [Heyndrickxia sporothermodurans]
MMKNSLLIKTWLLIIVLIMMGCSHEHDSKESRLALMKTTQPAPVKIRDQQERSISEQVKNEVLQNKAIYDAAVIEGDKRILVAYKVKHFYRFKMKRIEKNLQKQLKHHFPKKKFIVSSDYKIFLESVRLKEAISDRTISQKEAKKRFNEIIKLTEELT